MAGTLDSPAITSIDPTLELTGSEIVSREIDPVLFTHLLTTDNFPSSTMLDAKSTEHWDIVTYLTQFITSRLSWSSTAASHPSHTNSGPPVTPFPIGTCGGA